MSLSLLFMLLLLLLLFMLLLLLFSIFITRIVLWLNPTPPDLTTSVALRLHRLSRYVTMPCEKMKEREANRSLHEQPKRTGRVFSTVVVTLPTDPHAPSRCSFSKGMRGQWSND